MIMLASSERSPKAIAVTAGLVVYRGQQYQTADVQYLPAGVDIGALETLDEFFENEPKREAARVEALVKSGKANELDRMTHAAAVAAKAAAAVVGVAGGKAKALAATSLAPKPAPAPVKAKK